MISRPPDVSALLRRNRAVPLASTLLPVVLEEKVVDELLANPGIELHIDIARREVVLPDFRTFRFPLDSFAQTCLIEGVDQLGYLLKHAPAISRFEDSLEVQHAS